MKDWSKFQKARLNSTIGNCTKQFALYYMQSLWTLSPVHGEITECCQPGCKRTWANSTAHGHDSAQPDHRTA